MQRLWIVLVVFVFVLLLVTGVGAQQNPNLFPFTVTTDPASLIGSYYNAISLRDYSRAYGYWMTPPQNQTLAQFSAGFADTASAVALVTVPYVMDAGAGNIYASLPTIVVAQRTNGTQAYYAGCFTTHKSNVPVGNATEPSPDWSIQSAHLARVPSMDLALARLAQPCGP